GAGRGGALGFHGPGAVAQVVERATHNRVVAGSSPAGTTMPDAVIGAIRATDLLAKGEHLLVAFSGGHDSTALLLALREEGHDIVAAHYGDGLQEGSALVVDHVRHLCEMLGVRLIIERRSSPLTRGSVQAAARTLRYEFLERAAADVPAAKIALAHTADDLIEGAAMHLLRGCGLAGMRGMPAMRGRFVRPLLSVWRSDVMAYLESRGVVALEDPANSNLSYARVRMRKLEAMVRLTAGERGGTGIDLPGGLRFRVVGSRVEVVPRVPLLVEAVLSVRSCTGCSESGAVHLKPGLELTLGHRRPGLRMRPAGGAGTRKLQDILVDARVPREERDVLPLVFAGDR